MTDKSKQNISYVFGTHDEKSAKSLKQLGLCSICDQPIYGSGAVKAFTADGDMVPLGDALEQSKKNSYFKYMDMKCLFYMAMQVHNSLHTALGEEKHN